MKIKVKILLPLCLSAICTACGDSQTLPETGKAIKNGQGSSSDQQAQRSNSDDQVILTGSDQRNQVVNNTPQQTFDDANRFGEIGKKSQLGDAVSATEEMTTPGLASGTLLQEWRYGKLPSTIGQSECANHPKKSECDSKATVFTRGASFGTNRCKCL